MNIFQLKSDENFSRLQEYICRIEAGGLKFPSRGGRVNKTAVANACGFNRETFNQNKRFERLLGSAVERLGLEPAHVDVNPERDNRDRAKINLLEQQLASLRSENYELRRRLARFEHSAITGRRVID